jgi:aminopeptidase YwaD
MAVGPRLRVSRLAGSDSARWVLLFVLALPGSLTAQARPAPSSARDCPAVQSSRAPLPVIEHVRYLSDDAMEGREVGSRGEGCSAAYLAQRFAELGLVPAGANGSWFQTFQVRGGSTLTGPGALEISGRSHETGKAWQPYGFSAAGDVRSRTVYIGPGVSMPGLPEDSYAHVDLNGAVAVVEAVWTGVSGMRADIHFKATVAQGRGASALLVLLPQGAALPDLASENRPILRIPVAAVSATEAEPLRQAAAQGVAARVAAAVQPRMLDGTNVAALLPGSDPALSAQIVVVGAHHDHLGFGGEGSLAPGQRAIHNGADDNASGTAALLEIAKKLQEGRRPARSVLFLAFGGEERGLLGSSHYVENPLRPLDRTIAMINLDMVGRLGTGRPLTVFGIGTATQWEDIVRAAANEQTDPLGLTLLPDGFGPSDHSAFYGKGIPVLHFFTGTHADYHRPTDDDDKIDAVGLERVAAVAASVTSRIAGTDTRVATALTPVAGAGAPHSAPLPGSDAPATTTGYGPYFGSIPDMTPQDFGVRLTGVREDSPAAKAGVREGDVIVSFGGKPTADLYAYTYALQERKVGDRVEIVVVRNGQRVTLTAVLTERP